MNKISILAGGITLGLLFATSILSGYYIRGLIKLEEMYGQKVSYLEEQNSRYRGIELDLAVCNYLNEELQK